jgi:L-aspartate oxidase
MGGVKTDVYGATSIGGLYAAGEVACTGVHGANRLASNSLLEGLVFGARAGESAAGFGRQRTDRRPDEVILSGQRTVRERSTRRASLSQFDREEIRHVLRKTMWERVGIVRCSESLGEAQNKLQGWFPLLDMSFETRRELELQNMIEVSRLITEAAILRRNSVGAHYRSDFPGKDEGWSRHIQMSKQGGIRPDIADA